MDFNITKMVSVLWVLALTALVEAQDPDPPVYRLPQTATPMKYGIRVAPDMNSGVIDGTVIIYVTTTSNTNLSLTEFVLHAGSNVSINETSAKLVDSNGMMKNFGSVECQDDSTLLRLRLPDGELLAYNHVYVISLEFQSYLNTEPKGLFMGYYNATSKYIASNFRPTHARDVFPCFDEPQYKVPITLEILRPEGYYAFSTAPLFKSTTSNSSDMVLDTFYPTEPISIHSLGLFISQQTPVSSMEVSLIVPPNTTTTVDYLTSLISNITSSFGMFPVSPLKLIVLPDRVLTSFSSLGFVFVSPEIYLGKVGSLLQLTSHKLQLTEEFIRQFLEFSKTPIWWSDLWLSDSVGAYLAVPFQKDEPWIEDWLKIMIRSKALGAYNTTTAPVISSQLLTKWDIENIVSNNSVKVKGLSILLMWRDTMPEGLVDKTLQDFLKLHNTVVSTTDLIELMVANIKKNTTYDVTGTIELLPNWLTSSGSPLVSFSVNTSTKAFTLVQETSCSTGSSPGSPIYPISIAIPIINGNTSNWNKYRQGQWLLNSSSQFRYDQNHPEWTMINIESAPFRVNYEPTQWANFTAHFSNMVPLSVSSTLQDDAIALSLSGCLDFSVAFSIMSNSQKMGLGWFPVVRAAEAFTDKIGNDWYGLTAFGLYFQTLFTADQMSQLDVRKSLNNNVSMEVTRELVTPWLCQFNITSCREAVVEMAGPLWQGDTSMIDGSDLTNVACYGARYTSGALDPLLSAYQNASTPILRHLYTVALSCLTETSSVQRLLTLIVNGSSPNSLSADYKMSNSLVLRPTDAQQVLIGLSTSKDNSEAILDLILQQPYDIQSKFGVGTLSTVIKNLAKSRTDLSKLGSLDESLDLDPYVIQSADDAISRSNFNKAWWSNYSSQLLASLPTAEISTTTTKTTSSPNATTSTTNTTTTSKPLTTSQPPSSAPSTYDLRVVTLILSALCVVLDVTL